MRTRGTWFSPLLHVIIQKTEQKFKCKNKNYEFTPKKTRYSELRYFPAKYSSASK